MHLHLSRREVDVELVLVLHDGPGLDHLSRVDAGLAGLGALGAALFGRGGRVPALYVRTQV